MNSNFRYPTLAEIEALKQNARELLGLIKDASIDTDPKFIAVLEKLADNPMREDLR